jgi:hypothetical protein
VLSTALLISDCSPPGRWSAASSARVRSPTVLPLLVQADRCKTHLLARHPRPLRAVPRNLNLLNARHWLLCHATLQVFLALDQPPVLLGSNQQPRTLRIPQQCTSSKPSGVPSD